MSDKDTATQDKKSFTGKSQLAALIEMTGDLDTAESVQSTMPKWLTEAAPEAIAAYASAMVELQASQLKVQPALDSLKPLYEFCRIELTQLLTTRYGVAFDVEEDRIELPGFDCGCPGATEAEKISSQQMVARRSLLQAAMHNFTEEEAGKDGFPAAGVVRIASTPEGLSALTPRVFANVCRELDLGQRYQDHYAATFNSSVLDADIRQLKANVLKVDAHTAYLKGDIGLSALRMLEWLDLNSGNANASGAKPILYQNAPIHMQGLELFGACMWGVVIFSKRPLKDHPIDWCVVYMPNEPGRPVFEYNTFALFERYLSRQLNISTYADFFSGYIDESNKADFYSSLAKKQDLSLATPLIPFMLFTFLYQSHVTKMHSDALLLAVSTATVDAEERQKRLQSYEEAGLLIANIAGLFVPVLGQLMMGVAIGQLLGEVYEGVEDWRHDDKAGALAHLLNVAENLAMMAAFAAGTKVIGSLIKRTVAEHPVFFSQFIAVYNSAAKTRLWKPYVEPYQQIISGGVVADSQGIYQVNSQTFIKINAAVYEVIIDAALGKWRVKHPTRNEAYSPVVERNTEGGWRFAHEHPDEWSSGLYALKRIAPRLAELDEGRLENARRITDTTVSQLHRLGETNSALPTRLKDCIERFRIEQRLSDFIEAMESGDAHSIRHTEEQLHTLPSLPGWPADRYIDVVGDNGLVTARYPSTTLVEDHELSVVVSQEQLRRGELLETLIAGLYSEEVDTLLGVKAAKSTEGSLLAKKIGAAVKSDRRSAFDHLYRHYDKSGFGNVQKLRSHYPGLPAGVAKSLVDAASSVERLHLNSTRRVPMNLAQKVNQTLSELRFDRALSGLYLPEIAAPDSQLLGIRLLSRMRGWSNTLRVELRQGTPSGVQLASVGSEEASIKRVIVRTELGHEAFDATGQSLGSVVSGNDSLYGAVVRAIPSDQRIAMGIGGLEDTGGSSLRKKLFDKGLEDRADTERLFSGEPADASALRSDCLEAGAPASGSRHPLSLIRKIKTLYPLLSSSEANELLDEFGPDHLARATEVKRRLHALKALRKTLDTWINEVSGRTWTPFDETEIYVSRCTVADRIEDCWRRMFFVRYGSASTVHGLKLDGMRVDKLPLLPPEVTFDHVQALSLKDMDLNDDVGYFLKAFKNVRSLDLSSNAITRLPEALSLMPELDELSLAVNDLQLTEHTLKKLSDIRTLRTLNLSANHRLGATLDVSKMFDLEYLSLCNTQATEFPKNLGRLPNLDRVDLRFNEISVLPDWVFDSTRRFSETINLRNNPLSENSRIQLNAYRDRVGIGMGYFEDDITRLNEQGAREIWLTDALTTPERIATWIAMKDDPAADGLFRLLNELGYSADTEYVREDMIRRVWGVLKAAQVDTPMREQIFELAANPLSCTDSAALNFSHLEVAVEVDKVANPLGALRSSAPELLKLGRGLFRLDQLEQIAQNQIQKNPNVDALEVSLAYRTGLAEVLALPGQPRHMRYAAISGVTQAALDIAENQVKMAELSPQFMKFMVRLPFWTDYLQRQFSRQFASVDLIYPEKLQAVFETADSLTTGDYLAQVSQIQAEKEAVQNSIFEQLTHSALKIVELGICAVPDI